MRQAIPSLLLEAADHDERFLVLCGDHGYKLFDSLRSRHPERFINVGVAEQSMVGIAAGLCRTGFRPCIYGLAAFVPMRVLEQVKIDLCYGSLPVVMLGDGAGLTYSVLGTSHQCGEDVACLRPLPNIAIYSPCDAHELRACWIEARGASQPSYLRIGKEHPDDIHAGPVSGTSPTVVSEARHAFTRAVIVATGAMVRVGLGFAREHGIRCISVPRLKPAPVELIPLLADAERVAVLEEHVSAGGLWSLVLEMLQHAGVRRPRNIEPIGLRDAFTQTAGDHQHALSEHDLDDGQVAVRLTHWLNAPLPTDARD
jgi:transketolase